MTSSCIEECYDLLVTEREPICYFEHSKIKMLDGNLPSRIIKDLLCNVKRKVSKLSDVLILVEQVDGFHGWTGYHYGKPISKTKYENFLKTNRYICDW